MLRGNIKGLVMEVSVNIRFFFLFCLIVDKVSQLTQCINFLFPFFLRVTRGNIKVLVMEIRVNILCFLVIPPSFV